MEMKTAILCLAVTLMPFAAPVPASAASFDCARAITPQEKLKPFLVPDGPLHFWSSDLGR